MPPDFSERIINIKTSGTLNGDAKAPWKGLDFKGRIESNFIFRTALSKSILPFALYKPELVTLPITVETTKEYGKEIKLHSPDELRSEGYTYASRWFQDKENIWDKLKTEKSKKMTANDRIDFQRGITEQNLNTQYLVLYNASARDANAVVVDRKFIDGDKSLLDLEFIVESVTYVYYTNDSSEAFYLSAILNSTAPNLMMKDFQAKGLFGARHVHKKILDIYFPKFDDKNETHLQLAEFSKQAHKTISAFLKTIDLTKKVEGLQLGKIRLDIKKHLTKEMKEIDKLVKQIIG